MPHRTLVSACALTLIATVTRADVNMAYAPDVVDIADGIQDLEILVTSNPDMDVVLGVIGFDYDTNSDAWEALNPIGFEWSDVIHDAGWDTDKTLPDPSASGFFPGGGIPIPDGVEVHIASLIVLPTLVGEFSLASGALFADEDLGPLTVKSGDPFTITIVPEPASMSLLAFGVVALLHRRR